MSEKAKMLVLYGSQTFTAQEIAERIWRKTKILEFRGPVQAMDDYPISQLIHEEYAIFVCATTGLGEEPDNMKRFWKFLLRKSLPANSLVKLKFGVLGLGDSSYAKFNFAAKKLHKRLLQLGATPLLDIGLCDYQHDLGHDAVVIPWTKEYFSKLKLYFPDLQTDNIKTNFVPRWRTTLQKNPDIYTNGQCLNKDIYFSHHNTGNIDDVKHFQIEVNERITDESHFQDVRLIALKTTNIENLDYHPGDVFSIRPRNSEEDVEDLFDIFKTHDIDIKPHYQLLVEECHDDMPVPEFLKHNLTLQEIAEQYWDLKAYATQYVFSLLAVVSEDKMEGDKCRELSSPEGQEDWLNYCRRPKRTVLEVLHDFHKTASKLTIEILFELFSTIKPRSFSIASSCLPSKNRLELLLAVVEYHTKLKKARLGLCSNWMKGLAVGDEVFGWMKKGTFVFPKDVTTPLIMIGPGTGLAPFRSLIQERVSLNTASKDTLHLFFGCRYRNKDFHCGAELENMVKEGALSLYCAFSRDADDKVYVQHKISEHGATLWPLINEKGAHIFIAGNAKNMPDNVKDAFIEDVLQKFGGLTIDDAKVKLKGMEEKGLLQVEAW